MWLLKEFVQFACPGSVMRPGGSTLHYVRARIKKANGIFVELCSLRKNEYIPMKIKIRICNSYIKSVLLYGCEA